MKIAFDHQIFTMQAYGGISRYYTILASELFKQSQNVGVFAGLHQNHYLKDLPSGIVQGRGMSKYPPKTGRIFQWVNFGMSHVQMKHWCPDIIHETYYSSWPRIKTKALRVTSVHDMIHELFSEQFPKQDKTTESKKATFSRVDHILSISSSTKRDLIELFGVADEKVSVVHLGVDLSAFQSPRLEGDINQRPYLLYVGARGGYKNFVGFVKAFSTSSRLKSEFDVVAFGGGPFTLSEQQLIKKCGLREFQVRQLSGDDQKLAQLYAYAEAFVYPSLYEGFGLPPLEAMASGCPVVSSNTSSMPEVVRNAGEYFNPSDIEHMREAIELVVFSDSRKAELIELGYKNVKHFSWEKCARDTLNVYKKLCL